MPTNPRPPGRPSPSALAELAGLLRDHGVITDPDLMGGAGTDWTGRISTTPTAVVRPANVDEVTRVLRWAARHSIAVTAQGGNTGLVGAAVPIRGEVCLQLGQLNQVGDVDQLSCQVTVGAGATLEDLQHRAKQAGLRFPVDLASRSGATIGGMVATNAGGLQVIRYGPMRSHVVGIEAVLASGRRVSDLRGLLKDNTGYHLPSLLCGSEGTLAVITAVRVQLVPIEEHEATALLAFGDVDAAIRAAVTLRRTLRDVLAIELTMASGVQLVCDTFGLAAPFSDPAPVTLLVQVSGSGEVVERFAAAVEKLDDVQDAKVATDGERARTLWQYRERHTEAIAQLGPVHKLDVTLPLGGLAAFISEIPGAVLARRPNAQVWLFGHAGDGNIHVNVTGVDPDDEHLDAFVLGEVARRGGSISAEHGIGRTKRAHLHLNRSPAEIDLMRAIKAAFDPLGILAPGVLLPDHSDD